MAKRKVNKTKNKYNHSKRWYFAYLGQKSVTCNQNVTDK